jgi:hypothetical protein
MVNKTARENVHIKMVQFTKVIGKMVPETARESSQIIMATFMLASGKEI